MRERMMTAGRAEATLAAWDVSIDKYWLKLASSALSYCPLQINHYKKSELALHCRSPHLSSLLSEAGRFLNNICYLVGRTR